MSNPERDFLAFLDEMNSITILIPLSTDPLPETYFIKDEGEKTPLEIRKKETIEHSFKYICFLPVDLTIGKTYWIFDDRGRKTDLQIGAVIRSSEFDNRFFYNGNDLGVTFEESKTQFKVWAPTATQVKLKLQAPDQPFSEIVKMTRGNKGVWTAILKRNLELYQYSFLVCVNLEWREAVDPYAVAVNLNGEFGVIVNLKKTRVPIPHLPPFEHPADAIIYETHIRDFTVHPNSGIQHKGLYLGAGETNVRDEAGNSTGLSYVKDLGITHIEFLPFNDFHGVDECKRNEEYNWGYNPLHFNVPEGSYATNPANPYSRIYELKRLIHSIHSLGIRVIMDVVYNHVYIREQSSFEQIVPGYYFRHDEFGQPSNGTGVGNDFASERLMARKFIVDSVCFWITEYQIDGFRFDLMGILDVKTMNDVQKKAADISKDILILGEGWNLNTPLNPSEKATLLNQAKIPRIAQFNDRFRDCIKGSTFNLYDKGYALGNEQLYEEAKEVMTGSVGFVKRHSPLFSEPYQAVNYVECHDNHTLWDKLSACFASERDEEKSRFHRLATSLVLLAQGIPFLHSGQEFFRTKNGIGNSYRSSDEINRLDWERKEHFLENVAYIKGIIDIRKKYPCLRLRKATDIRNKIAFLPIPAPIIGLFYRDFPEQLLLLINPARSSAKIMLPEGDWKVMADRKSSGTVPLNEIRQKEVEIEPVSLLILINKRVVSITRQ